MTAMVSLIRMILAVIPTSTPRTLTLLTQTSTTRRQPLHRQPSALTGQITTEMAKQTWPTPDVLALRITTRPTLREAAMRAAIRLAPAPPGEGAVGAEEAVAEEVHCPPERNFSPVPGQVPAPPHQAQV